MRNIFTLILSFGILFSRAQESSKNGSFSFWLFKQENRKINGFSVGLLDFGDSPSNYGSKINGFRIELIGVGALLPLAPNSPISDTLTNIVAKDTVLSITNGINLSGTGSVYGGSVNGITIGLIGQYMAKVSGIALCGVVNCVEIQNGLQLAAINDTYRLNGLQIGVMNHSTLSNGVQTAFVSNHGTRVKGLQLSGFNRAKYLKGLQVGVFNKSDNLRGLQIGLINKNQKRTLPLINWNFKN